MLLAPIARLLNITLDTLLSFQEKLTVEEINGFINEMDKKLKKERYEEVFQWAKGKIEEYPNCEQLIWQMALILDTWRLAKDIPDADKYESYINDCYVRALDSEDENVRNRAADSLFVFYSRKEQYEKAYMLVEKQSILANIFEMGEYYEVSSRLDLAVAEKDVGVTIQTMERMLASVYKITDFTKSTLYGHMQFKKSEEEFIRELHKNLLANFRDEETYGYMKENKRWQELVGGN